MKVSERVRLDEPDHCLISLSYVFADVPHALMDATLTFISFAASTQTYSHMLVGAGIIPALVDLIKTTNEDRASVSMALLKNLAGADRDVCF